MRKLNPIILFFLLLFCCKTDKEDNTPKSNNSHYYKMNEYLELRSKTASYSGAILVAKNDTIIFSKGFGMADREKGIPNNKDTKFKIGSITKTFTAIAILQLQEKGKLSIENNLSQYFEDFPNAEKIKIKHLLNHTSGLPQKWRDDWYEKRKLSFESIINKIKKKELLFEPGQDEEYSNCGYALLTYIIESVSGMPYDEYCQKNIFEPANMMNTGAIFYPEKEYANFALGYEYGPGLDGYNTNIKAEFVYTPNLKGQASAYSTVEDLYNYDRALKNYKLLNKSSVKLLLAKLPNSDYTLGSWLNVEFKTNGVLSYFSGVSNGFESIIYRYLDENVTVVALNNHQNTDIYMVSRPMMRVLHDKEFHIPIVRKSISFNISEYKHIVGKYAYVDDTEDIFEIIIDGERIFVLSNNDPLEELFLYEPNKFFSKNYDLQLVFSKNGECKWIYNGEEDMYLKK